MIEAITVRLLLYPLFHGAEHVAVDLNVLVSQCARLSMSDGGKHVRFIDRDTRVFPGV